MMRLRARGSIDAIGKEELDAAMCYKLPVRLAISRPRPDRG
jgi:hypothetical protein